MNNKNKGYVYFVSYICKVKGALGGYGNRTFGLKHKIGANNIVQIFTEITKELEKDKTKSNITIINYQLVGKEI